MLMRATALCDIVLIFTIQYELVKTWPHSYRDLSQYLRTTCVCVCVCNSWRNREEGRGAEKRGGKEKNDEHL